MKPYADDWEYIAHGLEFSPSKNLYFFEDKTYDELSAQHNGIIGHGAQLKTLIKDQT